MSKPSVAERLKALGKLASIAGRDVDRFELAAIRADVERIGKEVERASTILAPFDTPTQEWKRLCNWAAAELAGEKPWQVSR